MGRWSNDMRHGDGFLRVEDKFYDGEFYNDQILGEMQ